ncbi:jg288 [Pararge aegeria aegeria]|uniref:unspecific monooxygenase n=1 Tax=Pararge aegeria aegeria TaxID=348720 RepID=A0A8S4R7W9_9NEOP|nr:jg288 [Pararge aegeria aegeria]
MVLFYFFVFSVAVTIYIVYYLLSKNHDYWKKRKVPHLKPSLLFGNYKETILLKKHQTQVAYDICKQFPGKIKGMFHLVKNCANQLECLIREKMEISPNIDAKQLLAMFTIDIITSCAFGINCNSMNKNADMTSNPFLAVRERIIDTSKSAGVKLYCRQMWPQIFYGLGFSLFDKNIYYFFRNILAGVFESREGKPSTTNDFVDLILTWKKNKVITGVSLSNEKTGAKKELTMDVDDDLLISQCVAIFGAGFETTATTLSFLLYEMAKNQDAQTKLIEEVDSYFEKNETIEYECVNELPYIAACIDETLRLYPVLGLLTREVMDDYTFPTGLRLKKGDRIHVPIYHIHRNPDYFPEPEVFRPERFYGDAKKDIKPFTFFPFGEGPRICLGK